MRSNPFFHSLLLIGIVGLLCLFASPSGAHPEDDFCEPGMEIGIELCQQLVSLDSTTPLMNEQGEPLTSLEAFWQFTQAGVSHILPGGTDHILFVLALFLTSRRCRSLILQISVFTVAHTVTLALTAAAVLDPPASIVEPLIALSIAVVALEVFLPRTNDRWKLFVVFGFGLFHGMGFAGFVRELGLPPEQFWPSLIGFNIGVEVGQLSVIAAALLLAMPIRRVLANQTLSYQMVVVRPAALLIAAVGIWWFLSRSLGL